MEWHHRGRLSKLMCLFLQIYVYHLILRSKILVEHRILIYKLYWTKTSTTDAYVGDRNPCRITTTVNWCIILMKQKRILISIYHLMHDTYTTCILISKFLSTEGITCSISPVDATTLILPTEDLILMSKHSIAPSSPPQATKPWTLLNYKVKPH